MSAADKPVDPMKPMPTAEKPAPATAPAEAISTDSRVIVFKPSPKSVFESYFDKTKAGVSSRADPDAGFFSFQSIN